MPGARCEDTKGVLAFRHVTQFERLVKVVVRLVRLVIEDHVNVVAQSGRRIFRRLVTLQVAREAEFDVYGRAVNGPPLARLYETERRSGLILLTTPAHFVFDFL